MAAPYWISAGPTPALRRSYNRRPRRSARRGRQALGALLDPAQDARDLALVDAMRIGDARTRGLAIELLRAHRMSIELLELAAAALGELLDEVVFVGGATVGLLITDRAGPAPETNQGRPTSSSRSRRAGASTSSRKRLRGHGSASTPRAA
jgi:hypothetical protein